MASSRAVLIFGGSSGIGLSVAKSLLKDNYLVTILSHNEENVRNSARVMSSTDTRGKLLGLVCDVSNEAEVKKAVSAARDIHGPASILVNAAGINRDALLMRTKSEDMRDVISTNLIGSMITCRAALRDMFQLQQGCIINIGSAVGTIGNRGQCVYSASKAGLVGFTRSLAKEVASRGIRVNLIAPGFINIGMTKQLTDTKNVQRNIPLQRLGEPEDVVELVRFLIHSRYITGQVLHVDGGVHMTL